MDLWHRTRSAYRSLIILALGTLVITGCQQGTSTPSNVELAPGTSSIIEMGPGLEVYPAPSATAVVGENLSVAREYPTYYLYILDRDGVPVQRFECDEQYFTPSDNGQVCTQADRIYTVVSEAVPSLMTPEQLPLKGEQPAPEQ